MAIERVGVVGSGAMGSGIAQACAQAGFAVTVRKRRGLFWNYLYVYGIKEKRDVPYI